MTLPLCDRPRFLLVVRICLRTPSLMAPAFYAGECAPYDVGLCPKKKHRAKHLSSRENHATPQNLKQRHELLDQSADL